MSEGRKEGRIDGYGTRDRQSSYAIVTLRFNGLWATMTAPTDKQTNNQIKQYNLLRCCLSSEEARFSFLEISPYVACMCA